MKLEAVHAMLKMIAAVIDEDKVLSDEDRKLIKENIGGIYGVSKRNDMAHLVGYALEKEKLINESDEHFDAFQKEQYTAIFRQENQDCELTRVCDALEQCGIDFIPLKGSVIRRLYPEPWMRTSCDIDILVKKEDFESAKKCLTENLRYKYIVQSSHDESYVSRSGVHVELHFDLLEDGRIERALDVLENVWEHTTPAAGKHHRKVLDDEMFYFYHITHLAKHFSDSGIGIRPFLDLYLLNKMTEKNAHRGELLRLGGLDSFENVARSLSDHWFSDGELDELCTRAELFVLNCGVYGSTENRVLLAKEKRPGKVKYLMSRIFLPYENMKYAYPVLKKHKWMLPFCYVARWFKLLSPDKAKNAVGELKASKALTENDAENRRKLLHDIGIKKKADQA